MKDGSTFNAAQSTAILLLGESGVGKSRLAMEMPSPYFCLSDKNIKFAADWAASQKKEWWYDEPEKDYDKEGKLIEIDKPLRWKRSQDLLTAAGKDPKVKTLVDDGLTFLTVYLQSKIIKEGSQAEKPLVVGGEAVMTTSMWNPFYNQMRERILGARLHGKPYIMTAHLKTDENDMTKVLEYKVAIGGQIKDFIGGFFTEVWCLEKEPVAKSPEYPRGERYIVRTAVTNRLKILRTTLGLPDVFEPAKSPEFKAFLAQVAAT